MFMVFEIRTVFYFLLVFGGRLTSNREIFSKRKWAKMFRCQTGADEYYHVPYMFRFGLKVNYYELLSFYKLIRLSEIFWITRTIVLSKHMYFMFKLK